MEQDDHNKPMTLDDLAAMVARGFEHTPNKEDFTELTGRMDKLEGKVDTMGHTVEALNSNVKNYLELSEKRYFELKQRDALLAQWLKLIAEKTNVAIDVSQLEKI